MKISRTRTKSLITKVFLLTLVVASVQCANEKRRLAEFSMMSVEEVVHRDILKIVGVNRDDKPRRYLDPDLQDYMSDFIQDAQDRGKIVSSQNISDLRVIRYVDKLTRSSGPKVIASCNAYFLTKKTIGGGEKKSLWREIEVLREESASFAEGEELRLRMLVYHELFHCLFVKGHMPKQDENGILLYGIMSEVLTKNDQTLFKNWHQMLDDMFIEHFDLIPPLRSL